ncbi:general stress protein [Pradoshia sp.]
MARIVYGKYDTTEEALQAVNALKYKGVDGADITILADKADRISFTKETPNNDVDTEAVTGESFMDKIASFFMVDSTERIEDRLMAKGVDGEESERLANDVENGKILILVDEGAVGLIQSELDGDMANKGGLYAPRNENKKLHEETETRETVGNMSRADDLTVNADDRLRDSNINEKGSLDRDKPFSDNWNDKDHGRNEDKLRQHKDTETPEPLGNMNRADDLTVNADDRLRDSNMNEKGSLDRDKPFSDNWNDKEHGRNEDKLRQNKDTETRETVGNMSRADNLSVEDDERLRDSNMNENDDLDKKKTFPKNRIDTDNL